MTIPQKKVPNTKVKQKKVEPIKTPPGNQRARGKSLQGAKDLMKRETVAKIVKTGKSKSKTPPSKGR